MGWMKGIGAGDMVAGRKLTSHSDDRATECVHWRLRLLDVRERRDGKSKEKSTAIYLSFS